MLFGGDLLAIYLQDHLAGATAGVELARRARGSNQGTELGRLLELLAAELEEDRAALESIMATLDIGPDRAKNVLGWAAEKAGRLKLNGRLLDYSPLSRLLELEALIALVTSKLATWRALRALAELEDRLDPVELDRLAARAERQLGGLHEQHRAAAVDALTQRA